jgi:hypothetical protein
VGQGSNRTHPTCPVTRRQGHERRPRRNDPANEPQVRRAEAANEADRIIGASIASIGDYRFHEGLLGVRGSVGSRQLSSGKVSDTHPVGAIYNHNLGVFTVTKIAMENTDAVSPAHLIPRTPKATYPGLQRCRGPSAPLTCLAWPTAWQSLCTGDLGASLKLSALTFTEPGPPEQEAAEPSARPLLRQRGRVVNTDRRGSVFPIQVSGSGPAGERDPTRRGGKCASI